MTFRTGHLAYAGLVLQFSKPRPPCVLCAKSYSGTPTQKVCGDCMGKPEYRVWKAKRHELSRGKGRK